MYGGVKAAIQYDSITNTCIEEYMQNQEKKLSKEKEKEQSFNGQN